MQKPHIVIIGAGIAGLSAAHKLKKKNVEVTILEVRDRVGGRIHTIPIDEGQHLTIEMGGEWIGKSHARIQSLCKDFNLKLAAHKLEVDLFYKGKYAKQGTWRLSKNGRLRLHSIVKTLKHAKTRDLEQLHDIDLWHYLVRNHIPQRDIELTDLIESTNYGESIRFVSSSEILSTYIEGELTELTDYYRIEGGNSRLTQALAKQFKIHLNTHVKHVSKTDKTIHITCSNGKKYTADYLICTAPAYSIININWNSVLPDTALNALCSLNYCRIMKSSTLFESRFWKNDAFEVVTDLLPHCLYHATQNQKGNHGVLTSYTTGDSAYVFSKLTIPEQRSAIKQVLNKIFPGGLSPAIKTESYYWGNDPYTKGAYAMFEPYQDEEYKRLISGPFENIYFAGEHLGGDFQGFMEGAVESGEHAAELILKNFS